MNRMKFGYLKMFVFGGLLAFGLFSCKSSKKAADASKADAKTPTEETMEDNKAKPEPVKLTPVVSKEEKMTNQLENYFNAIASPQSSITSTNNSINEVKSMFAKSNVPVLIIIHEDENGDADYDEPTIIINYLNYLKDQKKNLNKVYEFKTNEEGKITELILIRK